MSKETEHILEICSRIKSKRIELDLTQSQLAKNSGVSKGTISRYEKATGDEQPTFGVVMKLSKALGVTAEWIYNGPAEEEEEEEEQIHYDLNAEISFSLLLSIFQRESPLHDGAVILANRRVDRASAILPVSESTNLHRSVGLRHRAAVGLSEQVDAACFIVSEETGKISFAHLGRLERKISEGRLTELLEEYL